MKPVKGDQGPVWAVAPMIIIIKVSLVRSILILSSQLPLHLPGSFISIHQLQVKQELRWGALSMTQVKPNNLPVQETGLINEAGPIAEIIPVASNDIETW
jgi:hypothetical protein